MVTRADTPAAAVHPAVTFGSARRAEDATEVELADWAGPLGLLLTLIEARRLDVLTVPLGGLAGAYLEALARLDGDRLANVSSFVAVASQLILIKSRAMLPRRADPLEAGPMPDEGPDPEAELRERLLLYRAYRDAGLTLQARVGSGIGLVSREPSIARAAAVAGARHPGGPPLDPELLVAALGRLAVVVVPPAVPTEVVRRSISLAERAAMIRAALRTAPAIVLQDLLRDVRDRVLVAITFLAMLELMKRRVILVEQAVPFGPITARLATPGERATVTLPAPDDEAPFDESLGGFR